MTVFPASTALLAIWLIQSLRNPDNGIVVAIALLPFGMFAAVSLGGLSIIAAHLVALLTVAVFILRWVSRRPAVRLGQIPVPGVFLLLYAGYAAVSATVLVRLFAGEFLVFPMTVNLTGTAVSIYFHSTMTLLAPGNSNIAQTLYIVLSCGFFIAAAETFRQRSPRFGEIGLTWAAVLNVVLGLLDLARLDPLLSMIRTADYTLANEHLLSGFSRVIGGFSEASGFGATSAAFFAYFAMSFLIRQRPLHGVLAAASLACAVLSLSSSGLLAMAGAVLLIGLHARVYLGRGMSRSFGHWFVIIATVTTALGSFALLVAPVSDLVGDVLDRLVFSKSSTLSGIERSAWAKAGLDAFVQTWGLGAGAGSLRANGLISVLLGSVGLPGTLAFLGFLWCAIGGGARFAGSEDRRMFYAARISAMTLLVAMLLSGTTPDPTLFLMTTTAVATATRRRGAAERRAAPRQAQPVRGPFPGAGDLV
ncbi:hypothetical protein [Actibacterium sp. MT2.3-13A]|uniref:hypothetical protein n=1 Tax=Actibacterium sp. MT2.3-13A TaxID=2828332 RepID=UPI001BA92888|nr:hypothetical protein [Actibacterium sp. MT2.3-13A]